LHHHHIKSKKSGASHGRSIAERILKKTLQTPAKMNRIGWSISWERKKIQKELNIRKISCAVPEEEPHWQPNVRLNDSKLFISSHFHTYVYKAVSIPNFALSVFALYNYAITYEIQIHADETNCMCNFSNKNK